MDGSHRTSVFAYKEELDQWLDRLLHEKKISSKKSFFPSKKKLGIVLSISILIVLILTVVTWKIFSPKIGMSSSSPEAYKLHMEGSNYHRMTEFRKAIESREKAVAIDPGFSTAYRANDEARSIAVDLEGNYVVAGVDQLIDPKGGWRVQKIDQAGNNVWSYFSNPGPRWSWASSVAVDKEGNYIIGGVVRFIGNYGWWAEKLSPSGSLLWAYTNNPTGKDDYIKAVAVDSYGNYILAGFEFSVRESNERIRVEKLSSTGTLLWSYVHDPTTGYDRANSLAVDGEGNYIVAGYDEPGDANNFRWRVEKIGPNGNLIWEYISDPSDDSSYGHDCQEVVTSIAVDDDGNYVIAGYDYTPGDRQWRVEKIDADGNLIWVYTSNPSKQNENPAAIAVDKDGSYVVAGSDKVLGDARWRMEIIDKDGNLASVYTFNPSDGSDAINSIAVDIDGNYIAAGFDTILGNSRFRVEKFKSFIPVEIDIKPGSYPNSISLGSHGNVPVAIFSTEHFDATTVDPLTVTLAGASVRIEGKGTSQASALDVDEDGFPDLVVHVDTTAHESTEDDAEAELTGMTFGGQEIRGVDTVRIIDEKSKIRSIPHRI
jgi:hypothetical protein